jgi:NADH-quinone oxidoreductase subunit N
VLDGTPVQDYWVLFVSVAAVLSMTLGNVLALTQRNIKRLLAYSSIGQAGYTLIGVAAMGAGVNESIASVAYYLFMYTFTNLLAFAVIVLFAEQTGSENIKDLAGLSRRNPWMALAMTVAFLSLAGIPPAAGFFGKFFLFNAAVNANLTWLAIVGVLNAIVGLYYYLVVIKVIYVDRSEDEDKPLKVHMPYAWMLAATTVIVILLGVIPQAIYDWAVMGAASLL